MLTAHHLRHSFGLLTLFEDVSFTLQPGEAVGLVGPNGCGKTTLLRILAGEIRPDAGSVQLHPENLHLGYLAQAFPSNEGETIESFLETEAFLSARLADTAERLSATPDEPALQAEYDRLLQRLASSSMRAGQLHEGLAVLGLAPYPLHTAIQQLSGGLKTRLALLRILLLNPQLYLLDEPTNHLDLGMIEWLEDWVNDCSQAVLIISHDRTFLNRTVNRILEMDPRKKTVKAYEGSYDAYIDQKEREIQEQQQAYQDQQDEIARLRASASQVRSLTRFKKGGKGDSRDAWSPGFFANRTMETMRRAKNLEKRLEKLTGEDRLEPPESSWQMKIQFNGAAESNREVVRIEQASFGFPGRVLLEDVDASIFYGQRIALLGDNGSGKTTLMRSIVGEIEPLCGKVHTGSKTRTGYVPQEHQLLPTAQTPYEIIASTTQDSETGVRSFLSKFMFRGDDVFVPVEKLSYGQKARLALAKLVREGCNFLALDEPINHLDIPARTEFEQALRQFEGSVLVVAHDRHFVQRFANRIWLVQGNRLIQYAPSRVLDIEPGEPSLAQ